MFPLGLLAVGEQAQVVETRTAELLCPCGACQSPCEACKSNHAGCFARLEAMGLRAGKVVEILHNHLGQGALLVKVEDARIALNRGLAMKIMVRRQNG